MSWRAFVLEVGVWLAAASIAAAALDANPAAVVEVFAPTSAGRAGEFAVRAAASGCSPRSWQWQASPGCVVATGQGRATATVRCDVAGQAVVRAVATGGGCAATFADERVVIAGDDPVEVGDCQDGTRPGVMVSQATGWYYRPGLQSTGQLNLLVVPDAPRKVRQTVQTYECLEVP